MSVPYKREGFHSITPYFILQDVAGFIDFVKKAFGAKEISRSTDPEGRIMNVELKIGDSMLMAGQANEQWKSITGSVYLYVEDTDAAYNSALEAGAESVLEPADQFYGDRNAGVTDPFGVTWWIATHIEEVSEEEISRRMAERG